MTGIPAYDLPKTPDVVKELRKLALLHSEFVCNNTVGGHTVVAFD